MRNFLFNGFIILSGIILTACASVGKSVSNEEVIGQPKIIFDTDFGGDADDLGALAMLHYYADLEEIDFLGVASWSNEKYAIKALAAVNQFYGRPKLALGVRETELWRTEWNYSQVIAEQFPYDQTVVANAQQAVPFYRKLLADAEPRSITIVTVGPLANIRNLLRSKPDKVSNLSGADLVEAKVAKFVIMGGQFPEGQTANGAEWNFDGNMSGVTRDVLETIQRPIVFSGYEVGEALKYGSELNSHDSDTPLYVGYKYFSANAPWMKQDYQGEILDNSSFDQTAVMFAVHSDSRDYWTLSDPGTLTVNDEGVGTWSTNSNGSHRYLILTDNIEAAISNLATAMTH